MPAPLALLSRAPRRWLTTLRTWWDGRRILTNIVRSARPDLLHVNSTAAMLYADNLPDVPVIWQVRDLVPLGVVGKRLYRRAARVAAISPTVRADLLHYANDGGKKITLLPPAVDTARFCPPEDRRALRARLRLPEDLPLIGMSAQFVSWKRHHLFLDTLEHLLDRPWHAVVTGANLHGDVEYLEEIRARLEAPPLADRVSLLPWQHDPSPLTAALDICTLTSAREPFGRVLIEAMACGVPVVAVNEGGPTDIIVAGETGLLAPAEPAALASALAQLLDNPGLRTRFGEAGRTRVLDLFSLECQRETLTELYSSLAL